jgi:hypothetical protein
VDFPATEVGGDGLADSLSGTRDDNTIQFHGVLKNGGTSGKRGALKPAPSENKSVDDQLRAIEFRKLFPDVASVNDYSDIPSEST